MATLSGNAIIEAARSVPVLIDADVAVVGGGTTGPIAAIAAARQGRRVVLIERFGSLGGNLTLGLNTKPSGAIVGGIPLELWNRARAVGAAGEDYYAATKSGRVKIASPCDPEVMKMLLVRMCLEAGVRILFETYVSRPVLEGRTVRGVIVENKAGRRFIPAKVVIDCSADGDIAAQADAPFLMGAGDANETMQPVTMYFTMDHVDVEKMVEWARAHPREVPAQSIPATKEGLDYGVWLTGFNGMLKQFQADTGIKLQRENITLKTADGLLYVNATRVVGVNGLDPIAMSDAVAECYRQIDAYVKFLRERIPGFENARIAQVSPIMGVRETRHIKGEYILTGDDVMKGHGFDDSIGADASAFDVHDPKGADVDFQGLKPYEIPYRCLLPLGVEQLIVAGRCISADHVAHGRTRNMPACMTTGQAAGIAAALAVMSNAPVRSLDVGRIQKEIAGLNMPLKANQVR